MRGPDRERKMLVGGMERYGTKAPFIREPGVPKGGKSPRTPISQIQNSGCNGITHKEKILRVKGESFSKDVLKSNRFSDFFLKFGPQKHPKNERRRIILM